MNIFRKIWCRTYQAAFRLALPLLPYREPEIHYSIDEMAEKIHAKGVKRILIVTDAGLVKAGICAMLQEKLTAAGIEYAIYDKTVPNPTIANVEEARQLYIDSKAQALIALGGGSAMDCAKAAACRIARPRTPIPYMKGVLKVWVRLPLLIAVPTTAGTGSETTLAAVVTDPERHHKYAIMDFPLIPRIAVLDYRVTTGLPKHITSTTGMDALTHAVEAFIGRSTTKYTRAMAIEAVSLIRQNLLRAYRNGDDADARKNMLRAAYCAGAAFSQSYVGYVHCVAHSLGGMYGTAHGLANSVLLPIVLRMYGPAVYKKLATLARESGVARKDMNDEMAAMSFIDWVQKMNDEMEIPRNLDCINETDIAQMEKYADREGNPLYPVPVLWTRHQLEEVYRKCMVKEKKSPYLQKNTSREKDTVHINSLSNNSRRISS